jgi:hypothetical protein
MTRLGIGTARGGLANVDFSMFFDRKPVRDATEAAEKRTLSRAGAFVRTRARGSIRRRKRASNPGQPPTNRTGILKRFIFFGYEPATSSVVIGPTKTNQVFWGPTGRPETGTVPNVLEFGGTVGILQVFTPIRGSITRGIWERVHHTDREDDGYWSRADLRSRRRVGERRQRMKRARIEARPFMWPALQKEAPKFPDLWRGQIRAA